MSATTLNPNVEGTAARYVAEAMVRVNPAQRRELLLQMITQAETALAVISGERKAA